MFFLEEKFIFLFKIEFTVQSTLGKPFNEPYIHRFGLGYHDFDLFETNSESGPEINAKLNYKKHLFRAFLAFLARQSRIWLKSFENANTATKF
jgi:hypothetical protein